MSETLPRTGIVTFEADGSDPVADIVPIFRAAAEWVEAQGFIYRGMGLLSARPVAGTEGGIYFATNTPTVIYFDDGTQWRTLGAPAPTDPAAATPGLRTLGSGATQAAAGNHTHGNDTELYAAMGVY